MSLLLEECRSLSPEAFAQRFRDRLFILPDVKEVWMSIFCLHWPNQSGTLINLKKFQFSIHVFGFPSDLVAMQQEMLRKMTVEPNGQVLQEPYVQNLELIRVIGFLFILLSLFGLMIVSCIFRTTLWQVFRRLVKTFCKHSTISSQMILIMMCFKTWPPYGTNSRDSLRHSANAKLAKQTSTWCRFKIEQ